MKSGIIMATILVIDDSKMVRDTMTRALEAIGYNVICAENGKQGESYFNLARVDVVVTDIDMPIQDGFQTIKNIRNVDKNVCIIGITGQCEPSYIMLAKSLGAQDLLSKSCPIDRIVSIISDCARA